MVDVPYGGVLRNTVTWDAMVSGAGTKNFELVTFFFRKTGEFAFFSEGKVINSGTATNITTLDFNTSNVLDDPSTYQTYDAITYVGDANNPNFPYGGAGVYDQKFDTNVLTIIPAFGAKIINTVFIRV